MDKHMRKLCAELKKHHKGRDNAIICKQLKYAVGMRESRIRYLVSILRREGVQICSCCDGYYYPETIAEVVETVERFDKYLVTLSATGECLLSASARI